MRYYPALVRVVGFMWTLPNTVIGMLLGLLTFQVPRTAPGALVFDRRPRGVSAPPLSRIVFRRFTAITFGHVILGRAPVDPALLRHELAHVRQYDRWGPLYMPVYGALYLFYGYARHPFELAAMREAGEVETADLA